MYVNGKLSTVPDPGNNSTLILSDEFFDGQTAQGVNPNEDAVIKLGDSIRVQQMGIRKRHFDFLYSLFTQTGNLGLSIVGNPPPASIRSNVVNTTNTRNSPLGFFYAADVAEASTVIR